MGKKTRQRESDKSIGVIDNSTLTKKTSQRESDKSIVVIDNSTLTSDWKFYRLGNLVRQRGNPQNSPNSSDFVVHLRLGDVLDNDIQPDEIEDVFHYGVSIIPLQIRNMINRQNSPGWWHYVKSKCYYSAVLAQLPPNTINRVVIVGSDIHEIKKNTFNNSAMYRGL